VREHRFGAISEETLPPRRGRNARPVAAKARLPVREKRRGNDRRVVRPVLEQAALFFQKLRKLRRAITVQAAPQRQIVGPRHDVDAVDLDEAEAGDHRQQLGARGATVRTFIKPLRMEQRSSRNSDGNSRFHRCSLAGNGRRHDQRRAQLTKEAPAPQRQKNPRPASLGSLKMKRSRCKLLETSIRNLYYFL
jgi:hypothetical protein